MCIYIYIYIYITRKVHHYLPGAEDFRWKPELALTEILPNVSRSKARMRESPGGCLEALCLRSCRVKVSKDFG